MRRAAVIALSIAVLSTGAVARAQAPVLSAKLTACETGLDPADRYAAFTGAMPRDDAEVMAMRFDLLQRWPGGEWERVALPGWGEWIRTAKKGVPGFIYTKRIEQLAAPATYRAAVSFRWIGADGAVIRTTRRVSRACRQPDWRPDLHPQAAELTGDPREVRVVVRNRGRGDAGAFAVHVTRGDLVKGQTVTGLAAGEEIALTVRVGRCSEGEPLTVAVDPAGDVDEADEDDNVLTLDCPG